MNNEIQTEDSWNRKSGLLKNGSVDQFSPQKIILTKDNALNESVNSRFISQHPNLPENSGFDTFSRTSEVSKPTLLSAWDDFINTNSCISNQSSDKEKNKEKPSFEKISIKHNSSKLISLESKPTIEPDYFQEIPENQNRCGSYASKKDSNNILSSQSNQSHQTCDETNFSQSFNKQAYSEFNQQKDPSLVFSSSKRNVSISWSMKPSNTDLWQDNFNNKASPLDNFSYQSTGARADNYSLNKKAKDTLVTSAQNNINEQDTSWLQQDLNSLGTPSGFTDSWDNFVTSNNPCQDAGLFNPKKTVATNWAGGEISTGFLDQEPLDFSNKSADIPNDWDAPIKVVGSWLRETNISETKSSDEPCSWENANDSVDSWLIGPQMHDPYIQVLERMPWHYKTNEAHFKREIYEHDWTKKYVPDPEDKTIINNRWKVIKKIGFGGFGTVFYARDILDKDAPRVAIKREPPIKNSFLKREVEILRLLENVNSIPKLHYYGVLDCNHIMVVDLLGPTIKKLIDSPLRLKLSVAFDIGIQLIDILEAIHSRKIVYRDLKPENILLGFEVASYFDNTNSVEIKQDCLPNFFSMEQNDYELPLFSSDVPVKNKDRIIPNIFLIDFGLSKSLNDPSKLREFKKGTKIKKISGTSRYASLAYHKGHEAGPLDDLESMGYVLLELLNKKLPWASVNFSRLKGTDQKWNDIARSKRKTSLNNLCKHLPRQFNTFFDYVRNTPRNIPPDYDFLRGLFCKALFGEQC